MYRYQISIHQQPGQLECTCCLVTQSPALRLFEAGRHARVIAGHLQCTLTTVYAVEAQYARINNNLILAVTRLMLHLHAWVVPALTLDVLI